MGVELDIRTLAVAMGLSSAAVAAGMVATSMFHKTYPGFFIWTVGSLASGLGGGLMFLRGMIPDALTVLLANLLIVGFACSIPWGLERFTNQKTTWWTDGSILLGFMGAFFFFTYVQPNIDARVIVLSYVAAFFLLKGCWRLIFLRADERSNFFLGALLVLAISHLGRGGYELFSPSGLADFMKAGMGHAWIFLVVIVTNFAIGIGMILTNQRRLEGEFFRSEDEVRTLSGILPICSWCKKVRDDDGYWNQVEAYVSSRTNAQFSHGICPACKERVFEEEGLGPPDP